MREKRSKDGRGPVAGCIAVPSTETGNLGVALFSGDGQEPCLVGWVVKREP